MPGILPASTWHQKTKPFAQYRLPTRVALLRGRACRGVASGAPLPGRPLRGENQQGGGRPRFGT